MELVFQELTRPSVRLNPDMHNYDQWRIIFVLVELLGGGYGCRTLSLEIKCQFSMAPL